MNCNVYSIQTIPAQVFALHDEATHIALTVYRLCITARRGYERMRLTKDATILQAYAMRVGCAGGLLVAW